MPLPEPLAAWSRLALDLPGFHDRLAAGEPAAFLERLTSLPAVTPGDVAALDHAGAETLALDVFMVEAAARRHALALAPELATTVAGACRAVANHLGCEPILSYPFYVRLNPTDLDEIRRFTPTEAEFRFIRMHRAIEDLFDDLIVTLDAILGADAPRQALAGAFGGIAEGFRTVNRTVAGFRDPVRMPRDVFQHGFRPYFGPKAGAGAGGETLEGPSGLQSPTFRMVCMLLGYRDEMLDGWTRRIGHYHQPATRAQLEAVLRGRDEGRSLTAIADEILGPALHLPHLHPAYGAHAPELLALAQAGGYVTHDVLEALAAHGVRLGEWPAGGPEPGAPPAVTPSAPPLSGVDLADLGRLAHLEAMMFGFHLEHVAITAAQIGYEQGTGGTSGVEFLLLATFRRAFPALWATPGLARHAAALV